MFCALAFAFVAQPSKERVGLSGLFDLEQMLHLADLAEHLSSAFHFHAAVQLVEAEADERRPLRLVAADRRSGLGNLDLRHCCYSTTASACASASAALAPPPPSRAENIFAPRSGTER